MLQDSSAAKSSDHLSSADFTDGQTRTGLTIRSIRSRSVRVPMRRPLRTGIGSVTMAPLVLVDLETEQGITGRAYLFAYNDAVSPLIRQAIGALAGALLGASAEPVELHRHAAQPFRLIGAHQGIFGFCMSALDVASWDALAQASGLPLARLLGGRPSKVPAYNSNGLGIMSPDEAAVEALDLLDEGFTAIKARLGRPDAPDDLATVRAIRKSIPESTHVMVDFNQSLSTPEAIKRGHMLDGEGVYWIEEPTAHDDYAGNAQIAQAVRTPLQLGENFTGLRDMQAALAQRACDFVMPDLERIGGVSGWLKAAALAEAAGLPMSSHLFPEVSCHLMAVTATHHWLEYVDWAAPILADPLTVSNGHVTVPETPGNGLVWNERAVRQYSAD